MDAKTKYAIIRKLQKEYRKGCKKEKQIILTNLQDIIGYERKHLIKLINRDKLNEEKQLSRHKNSSYLPVLPPLKKMWKVENYPSGKRFVPFLPELVESLERHKEINLTDKEKQLIFCISPATFDRLLKTERKRLEIKGRSGTKPGTLLKRQIPIKIFTPWDEQQPGFVEIDLVNLCGGSLRGEYINVLEITDLATCWNETQGFMGRSEAFTLNALKQAEKRMPFSLKGIDSDNDALFINNHFLRYSKVSKITFTRCRPGRKNDQAHVEQKNWSIVRQWFGYKRYETNEALAIVNRICETLSFYQNFFQPAMRLKTKQRIGGKVKRVYDKPQTPYQRVTAHPKITQETKQKLKESYEQLNPVRLLKTLLCLTRKLERLR